MAWVRYDDQLPSNAKVTAAVLEEPGVMSLHVLANTWSNSQRHPGYVPAHQPAALLFDRAIADKWANILVRHGLWHRRGEECDRCREFYADLPANLTEGYVFHDAGDYRPPARDRTKPGTPAELSAKRRAAGRLGGRAAAAKRVPANQANGVLLEANPVLLQANGQANAEAKPAKRARKTAAKPLKKAATSADADGELFDAGEFAGVSKAGQQREHRVSPEPVPEPVVATDVATTPPGGVTPSARHGDGEIPETARHAGTLVAAYIDAYRETHGEKPTTAIVGRVSRDARRLLADEHIPFDRLHTAVQEMGHAGFNNLDQQLQHMARQRVRASPSSNTRASTTHFRNYADPDEAYKDYEEQPSEVA